VPTQAQFTASYQTNVISAVVSNWVGSWYVGNGMVFDQLQLINGGALTVVSNVNSCIGYGSTANNNSVLVSGTGSVWSNQSSAGLYIGYLSNGNWMMITNGGAVYCSYGSLGTASDYNAVLVAGSNSVWGISGDMWMRGASNSMTIASGGTVYNNSGGVGIDGDYDVMVVTGNGSVWSNASVGVGNVGHFNSLIITNGGVVYGGNGYVGQSQLLSTSSSSNVVLVTGSGSVWSNRNNLYIGTWSDGNSVTISNGGTVYNADAYMGTSGGSNNAVLVGGNGATWRSQGDLRIGWGWGSSSNQLTIGAGGSVLANNAYVGSDSSTVGNRITVSGGSLYVTNGLGNASLNVIGGTFALNSGMVMVDSLVATSGPNGTVSFSGGTLNTKATKVNNGSVFTVGDGSSAATLNLQGGTHSFASGLVISSNALIRGVGTIYANLTLAGTLAPGNSPGALTNFGNLTLQPSAVLQFELGGTAQGSGYDFVLVTNGVATLDGLLQVGFINGFETNVLSSDTFPLLTADTLTESFTNVLSGERLMTVGGEGSFLVDYYSGGSLVLSDYQVIPEPGTLALCALGLVGLCIGRPQRLRHRPWPSG
jgi:T5SS/PEP-CTERM-associated repeat protein